MQQKLGDFDLLKELGEGTCGKVYLAENRFMKKKVCLKVLPKHWTKDESFVVKFKKEISQLTKLQHPNIVKIHHVTNAAETFFLVTDFITSKNDTPQSLKEFLASYKRSLPEDLVETILRQIGSALDYAHEKSLKSFPYIHRNIKPSNILIGSDKTFYLADFGLTKLLGLGPVLEKAIFAKMQAFNQGNDVTITELQHSFLFR